jgi:hypothetical protein
MEEDMFEDLLNLEDTYYQDGYRLGVEDGTRAGRIEGRTFGLEKGFEKFFGMGRLQGKAQVWEARLPGTQDDTSRSLEGQAATISIPTTTLEEKPSASQHVTVTPLATNVRLAKHIHTLAALTELASLSTANTEDAVSDFDDRLKRALAKSKVIETITGEHQDASRASGSAGGEKSIEDFGIRSR